EMATQPLHRVAPSFEDTERAFLALVENSQRARRTTFTEEERQLAIERITSCCWLGIKNGCLLLEQVPRISLGANGVSYPLDYSSLKGIMDTFVSVMTACRHRSVSHLFPGASYQRAVTCLHILDAVFGTFCRAPTGKRRTIHKEADLDAFLRQEANGRLQLGSARMRTALLHCLFHSVEEIRLKAFSLLTNEASHFLESGGVVHEELWSLARRHLSSPRPQDGAIGALLVRLSLVCLKQVSDAEMTSRLLEVCDQAVTNFVALQRDIASSSADCPIHGWLVTLTTCLSDVEGILKAVERHSSLTGVDYVGTILNEALSLSQSVLQYVLRIMVPRDQHNLT
ncbi:uncharacterized protein ISCGN_029371, partial [Ixodes scapularis]